MKAKKQLLIILIGLIALLSYQPALNLLIFSAILLYVIDSLPVNPLTCRSFKEELYWQKHYQKFQGPK